MLHNSRQRGCRHWRCFVYEGSTAPSTRSSDLRQAISGLMTSDADRQRQYHATSQLSQRNRVDDNHSSEVFLLTHEFAKRSPVSKYRGLLCEVHREFSLKFTVFWKVQDMVKLMMLNISTVTQNSRRKCHRHCVCFRSSLRDVYYCKNVLECFTSESVTFTPVV